MRKTITMLTAIILISCTKEEIIEAEQCDCYEKIESFDNGIWQEVTTKPLGGCIEPYFYQFDGVRYTGYCNE